MTAEIRLDTTANKTMNRLRHTALSKTPPPPQRALEAAFPRRCPAAPHRFLPRADGALYGTTLRMSMAFRRAAVVRFRRTRGTYRMVMTSARWLVPVAYLTVYLVWGSTYLAIRFGVETMSPSLLFGCRFLLAGLINLALYRVLCGITG